jgi:predicted lipase
MNEVLKAVKLSGLVYTKELKKYSDFGFTKVTECINKNDYAVVASNEREIYICVRGSDDFWDWMDNVAFTSKFYEGYGRLHHGFAECYFGSPETTKSSLGLGKFYLPTIKKEIVPKIDGMQDVIMNAFMDAEPKFKRIYIVGHSKGSTICELFGYDIYNLGYFPTIYTFGCPRVGKSEFCKRFNDTTIRYVRFVNSKDPVPRLPRAYMGFKDTIKPYKFVNEDSDSLLWFGDKKDHYIDKYEAQVKKYFYEK